jgi:hypothetical protein
MRALHRRGLFYLSIAQQRDEDPECQSVRDQFKGPLIELIELPTTEVPLRSSRSSALQNIGVSNVVGRVRIYGPHFVCTLSWRCPAPSMTSNSCAHASSHIIHKINPTQPLCNPCACHASKPKREGRGDDRVESVIVRGRVKRVYPSCHVRTVFERGWPKMMVHSSL